MPSTPSLLASLQTQYPDFTFSPSDHFAWSSETHTIYYDEADPDNSNLLLHELAHGLLGHQKYSKDIELTSMETEAWDKAATIGAAHGISISDDIAQSHLDTYREWLHARSACPSCDATGYQSNKSEYTCVACSHTWRVNEARTCELRRYSKK